MEEDGKELSWLSQAQKASDFPIFSAICTGRSDKLIRILKSELEPEELTRWNLSFSKILWL